MKIGFSAISLSAQGIDTAIDMVKAAGYQAIEFVFMIGDEVSSYEQEARRIPGKASEAGLTVEALRWGNLEDGIKIAAAAGAPLLAAGVRAKEGEKQVFKEQVRLFKKSRWGSC